MRESGFAVPGREAAETTNSSIVYFLNFINGEHSADTQAPYCPQYPPIFRLVNATAVPVFRTRYGSTANRADASAFENSGPDR